MSKLNCVTISYGNSGHVQQILTGLFLLKQEGLINLISKIQNHNSQNNNEIKPFFQDQKDSHLKVILDDKIIIYYDMHDSYEIDKEELYNVDIYFKRSYLDSYINALDTDKSKKIFPFGLNYWVYPDTIDINNIKRSLLLSKGKSKLMSFLLAINLPTSLTNSPKLKNLQQIPTYNNMKNKNILFMARTWDPYNKDRSSHEIDQLNVINETRASCIRALRKEFGKEFYGGFSQTPHTLKYYKDCIIPNTNLTTKNKYIDLLKQFSICIATTGLHGSIGWKLGEYVAMSKAIVSEKLIYSVPGGFKVDKNYLEFQSESDCVEQTLLLYQDDKKRHDMIINNAEYYYSQLKPDALVFNSILKALSSY